LRRCARYRICLEAMAKLGVARRLYALPLIAHCDTS
jgi:hypothetical protein